MLKEKTSYIYDRLSFSYISQYTSLANETLGKKLSDWIAIVEPGTPHLQHFTPPYSELGTANCMQQMQR